METIGIHDVLVVVTVR